MNLNNLLFLCKYKNINIIKNYFIKYKDNINLNNNNNKLFIYLLRSNKIELFKYFYRETNYGDYEFKIDKKHKDIYKSESLLCYLCRYGYEDIIKYLCENEINIDLYEKFNEPIVISCQQNNIKVVNYLYKYYKDKDIFSDEVILEYSLYKGNYDIMLWYLNVLNNTKIVNDLVREEQMINIINYICRNGKLDLLKKILREISKNSKILDICLYNGNDEIKLYLLNN